MSSGLLLSSRDVFKLLLFQYACSDKEKIVMNRKAISHNLWRYQQDRQLSAVTCDKELNSSLAPYSECVCSKELVCVPGEASASHLAAQPQITAALSPDTTYPAMAGDCTNMIWIHLRWKRTPTSLLGKLCITIPRHEKERADGERERGEEN